MTVVKVMKVFCNADGEHGNAVGIVVDVEAKLDAEERQRIAVATGFSETVFVEDMEKQSISIYNPQGEVAFAGHAVVGAVAFLDRELGQPVEAVWCKGNKIETWRRDEVIWVRSELRITPPWWHERVDSVDELETLEAPAPNQTRVQLWAWMSEPKGLVRARTFASEWGILEDEANGSGCMRLAAAMGRALIVHHGKGSVIYARPSGMPGFAEVGGRVFGDLDTEV